MLRIWRLRRQRSKIVAKADRQIAAAYEANDLERVKQITADSYLACQHIDERLSRLMDQSIRQEAHELDIAYPHTSDEGMWHTDKDGSLILLFQGRSYLRELIDKEKSRRFDVGTRWMTKIIHSLLTLLIGVIGALTGLVAVFQHKK